MVLPIGIYEKALPMQGTWVKRFNNAVEAGFASISLSIDETERLKRLDWPAKEKAEVRNAVAETGLPIFALCLSALRTFPLGSASAETRAKANDIFARGIDLAVELGARIVHVEGYFRFYEPSHPDDRKFYLEGLAHNVERAGKMGVLIGLENMDGEDVLSTETLLEIMHEIGSPWLKLYPDVGNLAGNGLDVGQELLRTKGHVIGVQLKDTKIGEFRRVDFGNGIVPFDDVFSTLSSMNYNGGFLIEMWNDDEASALEKAIEARYWLTTKMQAAGLF